MKLNKKGFTLVELLAVIVVLAIIALIGFTAVGGLFEDTRKSSAASTALSYEKTAERKCLILQTQDQGTVPTSITIEEDDFDENGSTIEVTSIAPENGSCDSVVITGLKINNYNCTKADGKWSCGS